MRIVNNSVAPLNITEPGKKIEYAGRVCYKSESKISDDSYVKFITNIISNGHTSVLEHEGFAVQIPYTLYKQWFADAAPTKFMNITDAGEGNIVMSSNIRGWLDYYNSLENGVYTDSVKALLSKKYPYIFKAPEYESRSIFNLAKEVDIKSLSPADRKVHEIRTFVIVGSRAFTHQIVRHRTLSFSQQSQRYCNFSNEKFGHSIDFILPQDSELGIEDKAKARAMLEAAYQVSEAEYFDLVDMGIKPETARSVLPNAAASIIVVSGTIANWDKFFKLRCDPHAQAEIRLIANKIRSEIYNTSGEINE